MEQDKTAPTHLAISVTDWNAAWEQIGDCAGITPNGHRAALAAFRGNVMPFMPINAQKADQPADEAKEG